MPNLSASRPERTLTVGVVGAGEIVSRMHLPVLRECAGLRVIYVADKNHDTVRSVARNYRAEAICINDSPNVLPKTDIALLAVPVMARTSYYELFSSRQTPVLAEKPLAATAAEAERICCSYPEQSLVCGFQRRSYASVALARRMVVENWFGPLRAISVAEGALTTRTGVDSRFYDQAGSGGGVLMDLGCHSLDLAFYISGSHGFSIARQRFVFDGDVDREVEAQMLLHSPQGTCEMDYLVTWLRPAENEIRLRFDNCIASLPCTPSDSIAISGIASRPRAVLSEKNCGASTVYQAFYLEWMEFLKGLQTGKPSAFSARSSLVTVQAVETLYSHGRALS